MPAKSLRCPCSAFPVPLDHYSAGQCGGWQAGMEFPLEWIASIVEDRTGDTYHAGQRLTATRCLGCPRETLLADTRDYVFDPTSANNPHWGTAVHEKIAKNANCQYFEVRFGGPGDALPAAHLFRGMLPGTAGIKLAGRVDKVTLGYGEIHDYKLHSESSQRFVTSGKKKDLTNAAQLNLYRHSLEQVIPEATGKIGALINYHGAMTSARGPKPWTAVIEPFLTEEEILDVQPNGGEATVREIITAYIEFFQRQADGMGLDDNLAMVPLYGRTMFNGSKCTSYCQSDIRRICDGLEGI